MTSKFDAGGHCLICGSDAKCGHEGPGFDSLRRVTALQNAEHERDELRAEVERLQVQALTDKEWISGAHRESERLRGMLAECFSLVRPGTDLSRRMREALGRDKVCQA
jgi:hypothetical protein